MENPTFASEPVRFGLFEVDLRAGEVRKQGVKIKLQEQALRILAMLLEHPGQVITREELRTRLWPADTFVDFDHGLNKAMNKLREALGDSAETPQFIETVARRGYRFIAGPATSSGRVESLAVLPLENLSRDPEQEYFAEGMTEALITSLAKIGALRVVSRTTAMHYKGVHRPLPQIAQELNVDGIVEGTVLRSGDRVRISTQLVDGRTDTHLWAGTYDRDLRDILTLQSEVAQAIAREVQVSLTPLEQAQFAQVHPVIPEAFEAYLYGRYHWNRRRGSEFGKAVHYFEQAISRDPTYAAAYSGLADTLSILGLYSLVPPEEGCGRSKQLALKALEMDPRLAEARVSLAWATTFYDFNFPAAEREFERAIELNPRYVQAHQWFGYYLALMGRYEEAYTEVKRALRLSPCSSIIHWTLGFVYWRARRYSQAIEHHEKAIELDPHSPQWHWGLGMACLDNGLHDRAVLALQRSNELSPGVPTIYGNLGAAYAAAGNRDAALKVLEELNQLSKERHVTAYVLARIHAALGNKDQAVGCLETAFGEPAPWLPALKTEALFDDLRQHPRFQDCVRRMNFPPT